MNEKQAMKRLRELLGKRAMFRVRKPYCTPEEREAAKANWRSMREASEAAKAVRDARRRELLAGDAEYQRLCAVAREAQDALDVTAAQATSYAVSVGIDQSFCFSVRAQGDSLADAIAKLANGGR